MLKTVHFIKNNKSTLSFFILSYLLFRFLFILDTNKDGTINNINLQHLSSYAYCCIAVFILLILGTKSRLPFVKNTSFSIFMGVILWFLLELICWGMSKSNVIESNPPHSLLFANANFENNGRKPFWGDYNKDFGKWRLPNDSLQKLRCNDNKPLIYKTNSVGARDKERSIKNLSGEKRIIFLGDSFTEGIMVNTPDRFSDILEKTTGNEHLNFGINGTSPINYYLTYKTLAKKFEHDIVIIGVLPANDFEDYSEESMADLVNYPIYRPYWKSTKNAYELKYSLDSISQSYSSSAIYNQPLKIYQTKDSIYNNLSFGQRLKSEFFNNSYVWNLVRETSKKQMLKKYSETSMFESYPKDEWKIFSYSLQQLIKEAKGKKVVILTIPTLKDIQVFQKTHKNTLSIKMTEFCKNEQVEYIDFLPLFSSMKNPSELYVACDGHWNEKGEIFAADLLLKSPIYRKQITF